MDDDITRIKKDLVYEEEREIFSHIVLMVFVLITVVFAFYLALSGKWSSEPAKISWAFSRQQSESYLNERTKLLMERTNLLLEEQSCLLTEQNYLLVEQNISIREILDRLDREAYVLDMAPPEKRSQGR